MVDNSKKYDEKGFRDFRNSVWAGIVSAFLVSFLTSLKATGNLVYDSLVGGIIFSLVFIAVLLWFREVKFRTK